MDGKLVPLRGYEMSDLDTVTRWITDQEVTQFRGSGILSYPVSSTAVRKFIEQFGLSESSNEKTFASKRWRTVASSARWACTPSTG